MAAIMDKIIISDLRIGCVIGVFAHERQQLQDVLVTLVLHTDLRQPGVSDKLEDAVDYHHLTQQLGVHIRQCQFFLIEKLAQEIARLVLCDPRIVKVTVRVAKPAALADAGNVAVEIERTPADFAD